MYMKKQLLSLGLVLGSIISAQAQLMPTYNWAKTISWGAYSKEDGNATRVEFVDKAGNIYVAGAITRSIMNPGAVRQVYFQNDTLTIAANEVAFVMTKYDSSGALVWKKAGISTQKQSSPAQMQPAGIVGDNNGNLFLAVYYKDSLVYDTAVINQSGNALQLFCLNAADGKVKWHQQVSNAYNGVESDPRKNFRIDLNAAGELAMVYKTDSLYIKKYSAAGVANWSKGFAVGSATFEFNGFDAKAANYVLASNFVNSFTLGSTSLNTTNGKSFIASINATGAVNWVKQFKSADGPGLQPVKVNTVCQATDGTLYFGGEFFGQLNINGNTTDSLVATGKRMSGGDDGGELFYGKMASDGSLTWLKQATGESKQFAISMKLNKDNKLFMMGQLGSRTMFLGTDSFPRPNSSGTNRFFIAELDATGKMVWGKRVNEVGGITGEMIYFHMDDVNNIYFSGGYEFGTDFGSGPLLSLSMAAEMGRYFFAKTGDRKGSTGPVGIKEINKPVVTLYPNPAGNVLMVNLGDNNQNISVRIVNMQGKEVLSSQNLSTHQAIDITHLANGIYMVQVESNGVVSVSKFIKQ